MVLNDLGSYINVQISEDSQLIAVQTGGEIGMIEFFNTSSQNNWNHNIDPDFGPIAMNKKGNLVAYQQSDHIIILDTVSLKKLYSFNGKSEYHEISYIGLLQFKSISFSSIVILAFVYEGYIAYMERRERVRKA